MWLNETPSDITTNNITATVLLFRPHLFLSSCTSSLLFVLRLQFYSACFKHALQMHADILDLAVSTVPLCVLRRSDWQSVLLNSPDSHFPQLQLRKTPHQLTREHASQSALPLNICSRSFPFPFDWTKKKKKKKSNFKSLVLAS